LPLPFSDQKGEKASTVDEPDMLILRNCTVPSTIDELAQKTGISAQDLYGRLFTLELAGKVRCQFNSTWQRC